MCGLLQPAHWAKKWGLKKCFGFLWIVLQVLWIQHFLFVSDSPKGNIKGCLQKRPGRKWIHKCSKSVLSRSMSIGLFGKSLQKGIGLKARNNITLTFMYLHTPKHKLRPRSIQSFLWVLYAKKELYAQKLKHNAKKAKTFLFNHNIFYSRKKDQCVFS